MAAVCIASAIQVKILYSFSPEHGVGILGFCSPPFCSTEITGSGQEFRIYSMKKSPLRPQYSLSPTPYCVAYVLFWCDHLTTHF